LPFDDNDEVPLGYKTTIVGNLKAIDEADGFLVNKKILKINYWVKPRLKSGLILLH
jgi:hypothetical protein